MDGKLEGYRFCLIAVLVILDIYLYLPVFFFLACLSHLLGVGSLFVGYLLQRLFIRGIE